MRRRRIVNSGSDTHLNHRADFETCPHCAYKMAWKDWDLEAHTLILFPRCDKPGYIATMTECPKCFEQSWVHRDMSWGRHSDEWPKAWVERLKTLEDATKLQACRDWAFSLCGKCKRLKSATIHHHAYRTCEIGMGPAMRKCDSFSPVADTGEGP